LVISKSYNPLISYNKTIFHFPLVFPYSYNIDSGENMNEIKHLPKWDQQNIKKLLREAYDKGYQRALTDVDYLKPRLIISKTKEELKKISHLVADTYNNLGE